MDQERERERIGLKRIGEIIKRLPENSISRASDSNKYECQICQDSHFIHPVKDDGKPDYSSVIPCQCVAEKLEREKYQRMLRICELPPGTEQMNFDNFVVYPDLKEAYEAALAMAEGRSATNWLTFMSDTDRGKTHLLVSICRHWIEQRKPARYAYVPLLLDELRRGFQQGRDYSYVIPAFRRASQAVGRAIRAPEDFGFFVLADERYAKPLHFDMLPDYVQRNSREIHYSNFPLVMRSFF